MLRYTLFGSCVTFDDAAERFFDLQYLGWTSNETARQEFHNWYRGCKRIDAVLRGYRSTAMALIHNLAANPLFAELTQYGIYDIRRENYLARCVDLAEANNALDYITRRCEDIQQHKQEKIEYRAARKANRSRWYGGGFGFSGAVKGAAMAGGINLLTGMAHSAFNAIGNAGSEIAASSAMHDLYAQPATEQFLFQALSDDLFSVFSAHMDLVDNRRPGLIRSVFSEDRAIALFENAQAIPGKREELLVQAFTLCPWYRELLAYLFVNFPSERRTISAAAQRFHVDLSDCMEEMLANEYTGQACHSEEEAQKAKARIRTLMREYNITHSETLDRLERDCIERICVGYEQAGKAACLALKARIYAYDARRENKEPYLAKIQQRLIEIWTTDMEEICKGYEQADESACRRMKQAIQAYDAPQEHKTPFLERLKQRVETIWSAEDAKLFSRLYLGTDITNPSAVAATTAYIKAHTRTRDSEPYLTALNTCQPQSIQKARMYRTGTRPQIFSFFGLILFLLALSNLLFLHLGVPLSLVCIVLSLVFALLYADLKDAWNKLTIRGSVLHPVLISGIPVPPKSSSIPLTALIITVLLTLLIRLAQSAVAISDSNASVLPSSPGETAVSISPSDQPIQTPVHTDTQLISQRMNYAVPGENGEQFNRYLAEDYQVYWYYDHVLDETGTEEFSSLCPDRTQLAHVFDSAISLGINPGPYIYSQEQNPGVEIGSDPGAHDETGSHVFVSPSVLADDITFSRYLGSDMRVYFSDDNTLDPLQTEAIITYIGSDPDDTLIYEAMVAHEIDPRPYLYSMGHPAGDSYDLSNYGGYGTDAYYQGAQQLENLIGRGMLEPQRGT